MGGGVRGRVMEGEWEAGSGSPRARGARNDRGVRRGGRGEERGKQRGRQGAG